jgi:anti-sigma factor RsiW
MTCQAIQKVLPLFVEGELAPRKSERVRRHLAECLPCRGLCDGFRQSQQWLRTNADPTIGGASLEQMRRAVWRRIETEPRPSSWWLAVERGWASMRRWASQPLVGAVAVIFVVLGSVTLTRMEGMGGSRLGASLQPETVLDESAADNTTADPGDDPEMMLAQATPEELADGTEVGEPDGAEDRGDDAMRIEIQTQDPNVRIIWFTPPASEPSSVEN